MGRLIDLTGQRFGRLTVVRRVANRPGSRSAWWLCKCDCGKAPEVSGDHLRRGGTRSCGCLQRETQSTNGKAHLIDLSGQRFGRWTVIRRASRSGSAAWWLCKCDCGLVGEVRGDSLRHGNTRSCGCDANIKHGHARGEGTATYRSWLGIHQRCYNCRVERYPRYGGRGIVVCKRWSRKNPDGFQNFVDDMGERPPGKSIDRYPNPDGHYEPDNCRWATPFEQQHNKRRRTIGHAHFRTIPFRTQLLLLWRYAA